MATKAKTKPKPAGSAGGRVRKLSRKQSRQKAKKEVGKQSPIPGSFKLVKTVFADFKKFWKPLGGVFLVYLILNAIFASGFIANVNNQVNSVRSDLNGSHSVAKAFSGFGSVLGSGGTQGSSIAQSILIVIESLAIIWALRHLLAGEKIRIKQAYYQSSYPLIPFLLVVFVIVLQFLPLIAGSALLALILSSAISGSGLLTLIFTILLALLTTWSFYMLSSSVFAMYIVTLPDMQPRQALRSAKNLVRFRRWPIMRRLLFLPICIFALMAVITVPLILTLPFLVTPVFFILAMLAILFAHTYLYNLYRGLIE